MAVFIVASYSTGYLNVLDLYTGVQLRTVGKTGTGATVGAQAEMALIGWPCTVPWSNTTVLVPDFVNHRVTEVDFVTGLLVKVWFTGVTGVLGVAATGSRIVLAAGFASTITSLQMYDLSGNLLWAVSGTSQALGDTSSVGTRLGAPAGVKFSQNGSYVVVAEWYSERVTRWSSVSGAYIGTVTTSYRANDVVECDTGSGTGTVIADFDYNRLARISEAGVSTTISMNSARSVVLVPGRGVLIVLHNLHQVVWMSTVAIATHPVSATAVTSSTATFTVALSANSATTGLTYTWTKAGVPVGTSSPSYTYTATAADVNAGPTYAIVCTITHATGYAVTNAATLTVVRGVTISPLAVSALVGGSGVTFTATPAAGNTVSVYAWTLGGVAVGTNAPAYTYTAVDSQAGQTLNVVCTVTATYGTAGSNTATVTVQVGGPWISVTPACYVCLVCLCVRG
jgi:hypothetical protein